MIKFVETVDEIVTTEILRLVLAQVLNDKGGVIVTLKSGDSFGEVFYSATHYLYQQQARFNWVV